MQHTQKTACPRAPRRTDTGFTILELLVAISVVAILVSLAIPAIGLVRNKVKTATALNTVTTIHLALQQYAGEETRHRYPPQISASEKYLAKAAPNGTPCVLDLLLDYGWSTNGNERFDRSNTAGPWPLIDPWDSQFGYTVDDELLTKTGPQRPRDLTGWNDLGRRPWAYVWSNGPKSTLDGTGWIYVQDSR